MLRGTTHITVILTCFDTEYRKCFTSPAINMYVYSRIMQKIIIKAEERT